MSLLVGGDKAKGEEEVRFERGAAAKKIGRVLVQQRFNIDGVFMGEDLWWRWCSVGVSEGERGEGGREGGRGGESEILCWLRKHFPHICKDA